MRRTATAQDLAAAQDALAFARRMARYLIATTGAPARTCTPAEADALDADALRRLARQHYDHPLAGCIVVRVDRAAAALERGRREPRAFIAETHT